MICPHCDYEWTPKVKNPKVCPKCKQWVQPRNPSEAGQAEAEFKETVRAYDNATLLKAFDEFDRRDDQYSVRLIRDEIQRRIFLAVTKKGGP